MSVFKLKVKLMTSFYLLNRVNRDALDMICVLPKSLMLLDVIRSMCKSLNDINKLEYLYSKIYNKSEIHIAEKEHVYTNDNIHHRSIKPAGFSNDGDYVWLYLNNKYRDNMLPDHIDISTRLYNCITDKFKDMDMINILYTDDDQVVYMAWTYKRKYETSNEKSGKTSNSKSVCMITSFGRRQYCGDNNTINDELYDIFEYLE